MRQVQAPVRDNSDHLIGTIAGGVAGGVVGNQFGGGNGKTALTVLGAVGGWQAVKLSVISDSNKP